MTLKIGCYQMTEVENCKDKMRKLYGMPPYDGFNPLRNDGYFARSIAEEFSYAIRQEAERELKKEQKAWSKVRNKHITEYSNK